VTPERWTQLEELFHRAVECEPIERAGLLDEAARGDLELRREVDLLLSAYEGAGAHLRDLVHGQPAVAGGGSALSVTRATDAAEANRETVIGPYHLLQLIGEGGMGEVWLAEQKQPVRRRVAVKLIKAGMNTREVIARFESERRALALMDHPTIAKVFEAGSLTQGTPYFAMEYVAGVPITTYCDNHNLGMRERLELIIRVCEGVQHAHQKAIIHRDLKPTNILVTELDGHPAPKIIDFGVAKALGQNLTTDTLFTRVGALIGTPEYMSPEQALSSGEDIDTRTDVYSLGIILYELLAGAPPLDLRNIALDKLLRRLREEQPSKPSLKIRTQDPATSAEVAQRRQTEPLTLAKQLQGDLDAIALKALEKEPSRRYGSPSELAADIGRYLRNEPVLAVAPSVAYRARKFARRYRAALATAAAFVIVLIAAAGISIRQSILATRQRNRADQEAAVAQAVNDFLQKDLLAQASAATQSGPSNKPDPDLKVRTALDRAAVRIAGKFDRQPEVEAAIRDTIGQTYMDLGLYPEARAQWERALELHRRVWGPENPRTAKTMNRLAAVGRLQGRYQDAEALFTKALEIQRRLLGREHPDTLSSMNGLALVYTNRGKYAQAETLHSENLEIKRRVLGPEDLSTLGTMNNLALDYDAQGKYTQAEALFRQTAEIERRVLGPEHPTTLVSMTNLASVYREQGNYVQAEALNSQTLEIRRRVLGPEHPNTLSSMNNLALVYKDEGEYAQAETLDSQTLEIKRRVLGPEHLSTLGTMNNLGNVYCIQGKYTQAEALFNRTLEVKRRVLGPEHPSTLNTISNFASMYQQKGDYALAETHAAQALAGRRHALGSEHPDTMVSAADLALAYLSQGKFVESEPLAREALEFDRKKQPEEWQRFSAEILLGKSLAGQKKYAESEPLLLEGYQGMLARKDRIAVPDRYELDRAREWLVQLYQAWGKPAKAAEWKKK
jgi:serine/threonine protein kinase/Tfp pilus assembly protein PilF